MHTHGPPSFGGLLRQLRTQAQLSQEELAEAAALSPRTVSDLERGITHTAHKATAEQLADALKLAGQERASFIATARGRAVTPIRVGSPAQRSCLAGTARSAATLLGRDSELAMLTGFV